MSTTDSLVQRAPHRAGPDGSLTDDRRFRTAPVRPARSEGRCPVP
ncbi:hypothetical protein Cus16_0450 [Curtobacterium sp. ER1/6]|nr:hypothetical protein Cus16_0450 [Curtobacterium sp. ER1/6]